MAYKVSPERTQRTVMFVFGRAAKAYRLVGHARSPQGQSSVEFALVLVAFLSFFFAAHALWSTLHEGIFIRHALQSLSHQIPSALPGIISDIFLT